MNYFILNSKVNEQLQKAQKEENNRPLLFVCIFQILTPPRKFHLILISHNILQSFGKNDIEHITLTGGNRSLSIFLFSACLTFNLRQLS